MTKRATAEVNNNNLPNDDDIESIHSWHSVAIDCSVKEDDDLPLDELVAKNKQLAQEVFPSTSSSGGDFGDKVLLSENSSQSDQTELAADAAGAIY